MRRIRLGIGLAAFALAAVFTALGLTRVPLTFFGPSALAYPAAFLTIVGVVQTASALRAG
jgi:hypothetical protein